MKINHDEYLKYSPCDYSFQMRSTLRRRILLPWTTTTTSSTSEGFISVEAIARGLCDATDIAFMPSYGNFCAYHFRCYDLNLY